MNNVGRLMRSENKPITIPLSNTDFLTHRTKQHLIYCICHTYDLFIIVITSEPAIIQVNLHNMFINEVKMSSHVYLTLHLMHY